MAHNSPTDETRFLFEDAWECWLCRENTNDCLHHIVGRGQKESKVEASALNMAPLCNHKCHLPNHGNLRGAWVPKMLNKTKKYLETRDYEWTNLDKEFYEKYKHLY